MAHKLSILEQINIMLRKAETSTPAEAEMIMKRAEKLMLRHGLDEAMIAQASPGAKKEEIIVVRVFCGSASYGTAWQNLGHSIGRGMGTLRTLQDGGSGAESRVWFIGFESDVRRAVQLFETLKIQAEHALRVWWKAEGREQTKWDGRQYQWAARRQFLVSFGLGAGVRLEESRQEVVRESESTGAELVLVSRKEMVNEEMARKFPKLGRARETLGSHVGRAAGFAAGRNAATGGQIGN